MPLFGAARGATPSLPRVHLSHKVRRSGPITCAPCAVHTAQTAGLRCVKVAQAHVPLTQGANVFVSWSAAIRLLELGCWMQLSLIKKLCLSIVVRVLALTSHVHGKKQTKTQITNNHNHQQSPTITNNHHNHHKCVGLVSLSVSRAVAMSDREPGGEGAARRRRERQLRQWARHEKLSVQRPWPCTCTTPHDD